MKLHANENVKMFLKRIDWRKILDIKLRGWYFCIIHHLPVNTRRLDMFKQRTIQTFCFKYNTSFHDTTFLFLKDNLEFSYFEGNCSWFSLPTIIIMRFLIIYCDVQHTGCTTEIDVKLDKVDTWEISSTTARKCRFRRPTVLLNEAFVSSNNGCIWSLLFVLHSSKRYLSLCWSF